MKWFMGLMVASLLAGLGSGCAREGCIGNADNCRTPPPCPKVSFTCDATAKDKLKLRRDARGPGTNGLGAKGDWVLENQFTQVVVAGLGNQNFLDPNGGSILDLSATGGTDGLNQILQVVGVLPADTARYTSIEPIEENGVRVGLQLKGTLDQRPDFQIATRYELQPCDPGVRIRTEIFNASADAQTWALSDGYYWSKREPIPFVPGVGSGYMHKSFDLLSINDVFRSFPFLAVDDAAGEQTASYAAVSCNNPSMEGFHSEVVSSAGLKRTIVPERGFLVFERFIAATSGSSVAPAIDLAMQIRKQVLGENSVVLKGKLERPGVAADELKREVSVLVSEGTLADGDEKRTPWGSATVSDATGEFSLRVPSGKPYVVQVQSFGRFVIEKEFPAVSADLDLGTFTLPSTAAVTFEVRDDLNALIDAEIFVVPADEATKTKVSGTYFGQMGTCAPWLGPPPGASPACNRVLVRNGLATADLPMGKFYLYAFHGPFWTLGRETRDVTDADLTVTFKLKKLALQPATALSADLHVHGAASFDSSLPDYDRVLSFAASDLDVIVATDHEVIHDYRLMVEQLGLSPRMSTIAGTETTGHIPWLRIPNYGFPLVIGHYNFWPLKFDPLLPRNGGVFDEFIEPGELMDRAKAVRDPGVTEPLIELNHPWADPEFGRDLGFPRALSLDVRQDLPAKDDGTSAGIYVRSPKGGYKNNDHHAQEVMNGSQNDLLLQYRAFWWFTLNQGQLKTGTANSDSHSLVDSTVGLPRNVVFTDTKAGPGFDVVKFNAAIRAGKILGTNGPIIDALVEGEGFDQTFGFDLVKPKATGNLKLKVSSAPWIPVQEIRVIVNGKVVKTLPVAAEPADPFGDQGLERYSGSIPLTELLAGVTGDAWIVVEAGRPLLLADDLGGGLDGAKDGIPDTTDNNGDGKVDSKDVAEGKKTGPVANSPEPKETEAGFHFYKISEGSSFAFTNPFLLDRNGDGKFNAPGVKGGR